jgi:hypothetical protein
LITASPDYSKPRRTPPFLTSLNPSTLQVQTIYRIKGAPIPSFPPSPPIKFKVVSEDLQSGPLVGELLLDFQGTSVPYRIPYLANIDNIPPGHLLDDGPPRQDPGPIEFTFPGDTTPGCHSVTLIVTHEFAFNRDSKIAFTQPDDFATATWWWDVDDDPLAPQMNLQSCVTDIAAMGDAGTDGGAP